MSIDPEVHPNPSHRSFTCSAASAVIVISMAAESTPQTSKTVAKAFLVVLVGFGDDCAAIGRLPAMVGVMVSLCSLCFCCVCCGCSFDLAVLE